MHTSITSKIRHTLGILMLATTGGCIGQTVDDVAILDSGNSHDLAMTQDAPASDMANPPPDIAGSHCTGNDTFHAAQAAMLNSCGGGGPFNCHSRAPFGGNLDLTSANAYASLVNVHASIAPNKLRVKPGDPDNSFLVQKLTNKQAKNEGGPMPQGEGIQWQPPSPDKLNTLRCWILRGAPND